VASGCIEKPGEWKRVMVDENEVEWERYVERGGVEWGMQDVLGQVSGSRVGTGHVRGVQFHCANSRLPPTSGSRKLVHPAYVAALRYLITDSTLLFSW
jgi:hypothetical protein